MVIMEMSVQSCTEIRIYNLHAAGKVFRAKNICKSYINKINRMFIQICGSLHENHKGHYSGQCYTSKIVRLPCAKLAMTRQCAIMFQCMGTTYLLIMRENTMLN